MFFSAFVCLFTCLCSLLARGRSDYISGNILKLYIVDARNLAYIKIPFFHRILNAFGSMVSTMSML